MRNALRRNVQINWNSGIRESETEIFRDFTRNSRFYVETIIDDFPRQENHRYSFVIVHETRTVCIDRSAKRAD